MGNGNEVKKSTPTKPLPTWRISFAKQLAILRGFAAASGTSPRNVANFEVSKIIGLKADTISLANSFFSAIGLLMRSEKGYIPSNEVMAYQRAYEWNAETAFYKVAGILQDAWFGQALIPRLRFGPFSEEAAIESLGDASAAGPDCRSQLELILDYMQAAGLLVRDNGMVKFAKANGNQERENEVTNPAPEPPKPASTEPVVPLAPAGAGVIQFSVNIQVDTNAMAAWKPENITAFLGGLAQVLAAKGQAEKEARQEQNKTLEMP